VVSINTNETTTCMVGETQKSPVSTKGVCVCALEGGGVVN